MCERIPPTRKRPGTIACENNSWFVDLGGPGIKIGSRCIDYDEVCNSPQPVMVPGMTLVHQM